MLDLLRYEKLFSQLRICTQVKIRRLDSCSDDDKHGILLLLMDQIGRRHIRHLLQSLETQPVLVMRDFFSELFVEIGSLWSRSFQYDSVILVYFMKY